MISADLWEDVAHQRRFHDDVLYKFTLLYFTMALLCVFYGLGAKTEKDVALCQNIVPVVDGSSLVSYVNELL